MTWLLAGLVVLGVGITLVVIGNLFMGDLDTCPKCGAETYFWDMETLVCRNAECNWKG